MLLLQGCLVVQDELQLLLDTKQALAAAEALKMYELIKALAKRRPDPNLLTMVRAMKRELGRRGRPRKKKAGAAAASPREEEGTQAFEAAYGESAVGSAGGSARGEVRGVYGACEAELSLRANAAGVGGATSAMALGRTLALATMMWRRRPRRRSCALGSVVRSRER